MHKKTHYPQNLHQSPLSIHHPRSHQAPHPTSGSRLRRLISKSWSSR